MAGQEEAAVLFVPSFFQVPADGVGGEVDAVLTAVVAVDSLHEPHALDDVAGDEGLASVGVCQCSAWMDELVEELVVGLEVLGHDDLGQFEGAASDFLAAGKQGEFVIDQGEDHRRAVGLQVVGYGVGLGGQRGVVVQERRGSLVDIES